MTVQTHRHRRLLAAAVSSLLGASAASAGIADPLRISEMFFDPPGNDVPGEYIELRGLPNTSLNNHYLVILEAEGQDGSDGLGGHIDTIFDLSGKSIGTNGFMLLRMFNAQHTGIAPGTNDYRNTNVSVGFGTNGNNSLGFWSTNNNGQIENGGFAAFLIRTPAPIHVPDWLDHDLDVENDGRLDSDVNYGQPGPHYLYVNPDNPADRWEILDSIGQFEPGEAQTGRGYAAINFSTGPMNPDHLTAGAINIPTGQLDIPRDGNPSSSGGIEMEYLARWGSRSGGSPEDWLGANVTDNAASGFTSANRWSDGYRVSGNHATGQLAEAFNGFTDEAAPYGTAIQRSLGRPNYPVADGDLSQDLRIDQADLDIVLDHWQVQDPTRLGYWYAGDPVADGIVDRADLDFVLDVWPLPTDPGFMLADMKFLTGDTNLDGVVDFADLLTLAQNYGQPLRGYANGDFNHDSIVDFTDLLGLAQRYGLSWNADEAPAAFGAMEWERLAPLGIVIVPEPSSLLLLVGAAAMLRRKR